MPSTAGPPTRPLLELTVPTMYDPSLAPPGKHIHGHLPAIRAVYAARCELGRDRAIPFGDRVIDLIAEYAPNIRSIVERMQVLTPLDLERRFGITGGNIFHGEMSLDQMFVMRPVAGWARYRTPIKACICAARARTPAAASWARRAITPRGKFSGPGKLESLRRHSDVEQTLCLPRRDSLGAWSPRGKRVETNLDPAA